MLVGVRPSSLTDHAAEKAVCSSLAHFYRLECELQTLYGVGFLLNRTSRYILKTCDQLAISLHAHLPNIVTTCATM
jgi:hypothetical protein